MYVTLDYTNTEHLAYTKVMNKLHALIFGGVATGSPIVSGSTLIWGSDSMELLDVDLFHLKLKDRVLFIVDDYKVAIPVQNA